MKIKKVTFLLLMVLIFSGCSPGCDETPGSYAQKAGGETGTAAGSVENTSKMELLKTK